jgi:hypothetical protein
MAGTLFATRPQRPLNIINHERRSAMPRSLFLTFLVLVFSAGLSAQPSETLPRPLGDAYGPGVRVLRKADGSERELRLVRVVPGATPGRLRVQVVNPPLKPGTHRTYRLDIDLKTGTYSVTNWQEKRASNRLAARHRARTTDYWTNCYEHYASISGIDPIGLLLNKSETWLGWTYDWLGDSIVDYSYGGDCVAMSPTALGTHWQTTSCIGDPHGYYNEADMSTEGSYQNYDFGDPAQPTYAWSLVGIQANGMNSFAYSSGDFAGEYSWLLRFDDDEWSDMVDCPDDTGGWGGDDDWWWWFIEDEDDWDCWDWWCDTPIIINLGNGGYQLSDTSSPVRFDMNADGKPEKMTWTAAGAPMAFLFVDHNGNGIVDNGSELFGTWMRSVRDGKRGRNGFRILADYDTNHDGVVDANDPVWKSLKLWVDANHDGKCSPDEVTPINASRVVSISLAYHATNRRDPSGNTFHFESQVSMRNDRGAVEQKPVYDVYFVPVP